MATAEPDWGQASQLGNSLQENSTLLGVREGFLEVSGGWVQVVF